MRNTKRERFIFSASDIDAMEEHFEEMASKGWMLEKTGEYMVKYRRSEPQYLKFSIDLFPKLSPFDHPDKDEVLEYRNLCIDAGWDFIGSSEKFQVFSSPKEKNLHPIQTDDRIKQTIVNKSLILEIILLTICLGVYLWNLEYIFPLHYRSFHSNIILAIVIIAPVMIIPTVVHVVSNAVWILRAKKAVKYDMPLPKSSYKVLRIKTLLLILPSTFFLLSIILATILDIQKGNFEGINKILPTVIGLTVGLLYRKIKANMKRSRGDNIGVFLLVLVFMGVGMSIIMPTIRDKTESKVLIEGYKGLEFNDFHLPYPDITEFSKGGSIILPKYSTYYEVYFGKDHYSGKGGYSINTEYYKAKSNKTAKHILDSMIKEYSRRYNIITADDYNLFDEAYYLEERNRLILLKDMEVFIIRTSIDIKDEKNIKIITDKLLH